MAGTRDQGDKLRRIQSDFNGQSVGPNILKLLLAASRRLHRVTLIEAETGAKLTTDCGLGQLNTPETAVSHAISYCQPAVLLGAIADLLVLDLAEHAQQRTIWMPTPRAGLISLLEHFLVRLLYQDEEISQLVRVRWHYYLEFAITNDPLPANQLLTKQRQAQDAAAAA